MFKHNKIKTASYYWVAARTEIESPFQKATTIKQRKKKSRKSKQKMPLLCAGKGHTTEMWCTHILLNCWYLRTYKPIAIGTPERERKHTHTFIWTEAYMLHTCPLCPSRYASTIYYITFAIFNWILFVRRFGHTHTHFLISNAWLYVRFFSIFDFIGDVKLANLYSFFHFSFSLALSWSISQFYLSFRLSYTHRCTSVHTCHQLCPNAWSFLQLYTRNVYSI